MQKWMAAALIVAVLMGAGCRGKAQGANRGGAAGSDAGGGTASAAGGGAPADEETVPGGFTVDTQKVENLKGAGVSVNEPD
ncbi:MAG TPA: hypothetical protein VF584_01815 [Longimicrobium sp.]|jgi:hypothetical protein